MAVAVEIKIRDNGLITQNKLVKSLTRRTIKIGRRQTWNLTQFGARKIRESHERTSQKFERKISRGIRARKLKTNTYGIFIPIEGIYLDRMSPHWVSLKRGRTITRWAQRRGIKAKSIMVKPHPFIDAGYNGMLNRLDMTTKRIADGIVK